MKIRVQLVVCDDDGHEETFTDVVVLEKACQRVEHLGLTLAEAKQTLTRPSKSWGSGRQGLLLQLQIWIPALEHCPEFLIQRFDPGLQEQMRPAFGPLHLLLLAEALADDLVDGRLDKTGADALPIPITLVVGGDEGAIAVNVRVEFFHGLQQFPGGSVANFRVETM
jgi:hypothetical protein